MPELPEIETIKRDLRDRILDREIRGVVINNVRSVRAHSSLEEFTAPLLESKVVEVHRKGKFLSIAIQPRALASVVIVAHMGMSGQLRIFSMDDDLPKHSHICFNLSGELRLVFVDPRTFGQMYLDSSAFNGVAASLARLGIDPLYQETLIPEALKRYTKSRIGVKWLLLDQAILCGIGNMYADEILFRAGIKFDRPGNMLTASELEQLAGSVRYVLNAAVDLRGSSLRDLQYRDVDGAIGGYQQFHMVYGREGEPCRRCGAKIERVFAKGRSSYLCRSCQR